MMPPADQRRIEAAEQALAACREEQFQGSARVRLDCLTFAADVQEKMDDGRNALRLEQIMDLQGCLRLSREYHVRVHVDAADWGRQVTLRPQDGQLPELIVPLGYSLVGHNHRAVIEAARHRLAPCNRWWVVEIYLRRTPGT